MDYYISPPFGNFINTDWATSIKGTFTMLPRRGAIVKALTTIRPMRNGWVNKMGLRNPGIRSIKTFNDKYIYSIAALSPEDWNIFADDIPRGTKLELNVSCPNEDVYIFPPKILADKYDCIVKLAPYIPYARKDLHIHYLIDRGFNKFHCCNTIEGISGRPVKPLSLRRIEEIKKLLPSAYIIGGGGIYTPQDVKDYSNAGVDGISLSTIWFSPWKIKKVLNA